MLVPFARGFTVRGACWSCHVTVKSAWKINAVLLIRGKWRGKMVAVLRMYVCTYVIHIHTYSIYTYIYTHLYAQPFLSASANCCCVEISISNSLRYYSTRRFTVTHLHMHTWFTLAFAVFKDIDFVRFYCTIKLTVTLDLSLSGSWVGTICEGSGWARAA